MQETNASQLSSKNVVNFTAFDFIDNNITTIRKSKYSQNFFRALPYHQTYTNFGFGALKPVQVDFIGQNEVKILG